MAPSQKKALIIVGALVAVAVVSFFVYYTQKQIADAQAANEQLMLQNEQLQLKQEYENLSAEFQNYESQTRFLNNDSLLIKYGEAKDKVEKLLTELRTQRITSNKRIKELQGEQKTSKLNQLSSTHPDLDARIKRMAERATAEGIAKPENM